MKAAVKRLTYLPSTVKPERLRPFEHGKMQRVCHCVGSVRTLRDAKEHLPHEIGARLGCGIYFDKLNVRLLCRWRTHGVCVDDALTHAARQPGLIAASPDALSIYDRKLHRLFSKEQSR